MPTTGRFRVDPDDPRPLYVQVMDEIRIAIVNDILKTDDPLPSVRELAGELRLNPNTIQQAYRELEREGILHVRRGRGTYVAPDLQATVLRPPMVRQLAERMLREAARAGVGTEELIEALRRVSGPGSGPNPDPRQEEVE